MTETIAEGFNRWMDTDPTEPSLSDAFTAGAQWAIRKLTSAEPDQDVPVVNITINVTGGRLYQKA